MAEYVRLRDRTEETLARRVAAVADLKQALADYAREHGGRFTLFGSAARREMHHDSDVDILVDFPTATQSAAIFFAEHACEQLGLKPDLLAFGSPKGHLRERIDRDGLVLPGDEANWSEPMSDEDRWSDIIDAARTAASHFRAATNIFEEGGLEAIGSVGYLKRMAFYHAMQSAHTALESALKRALVALGERPPTGADWHRVLIERAERALGPQRRALLPAKLAAAAQETREFRHFAVYGYDMPFKPDKARVAVEAGLLIADHIEGELRTFRNELGSN